MVRKTNDKYPFQNGWISIGSCMYGYRAVEGNQLEIVEDEAAVVREIFGMYLGGMGTVAISKVLNDRGLKTSRGNAWSPNAILEIISNEKYTGDALMGKHVRINGVHMKNDGGRYSQQYIVHVDKLMVSAPNIQTYYRLIPYKYDFESTSTMVNY